MSSTAAVTTPIDWNAVLERDLNRMFAPIDPDEGRERVPQHERHDDDPGPCVDCHHAARCGSESLACEQFAQFVKAGASQRWRLMPRQPSAAIFAALFGEAR
jgi:hypothetical protein